MLKRLILHPKVYSDIDKIMEYYEQVTTAGLASEFYAELPSIYGRGSSEAGIIFDQRA